MTVTPLDDLAYINLRELQPGDHFTLRDEQRTVLECVQVIYPIENEPWVRAWELEGPRREMTRRMFRAVRISRVNEVLK